jgi:hypothetical protein
MLYNRNVIYDPSASIGSGFTQIVGLALDSKKNLWTSTMFTFNQLYVKTPENEWYKFKVPGSQYGGIEGRSTGLYELFASVECVGGAGGAACRWRGSS